MPSPKLGDIFPALPPVTFIHGTPPDAAQRTPLLVEAWATWCPPCRVDIKYLESYYQRFAPKLHVVAVAVREPGSHEEAIDSVKSFIRTWKLSPISYSVAVDGPSAPESSDRMFEDAFLESDGKKLPMPFCFLVNEQGVIVYAGKREFLMGKVEQVVNGGL